MRLTRCQTAPEFAARAEPFLLAHEAEHCVLLGLTTQLTLYPDTYENSYFAVVEGDGRVVAAAIMTPPQRVLLSLVEAPEALDVLARDIHSLPGGTPGVIGPLPGSRLFAERWQALTGQGFERHMAERLYALTHVRPQPEVPGRLRRADEGDFDLAVRWFDAFNREAFSGSPPSHEDVERRVRGALTHHTRGLYLWEDEQPVSLAGYGGPTPHGIRLGPVYTPPEFRRRGYASALVAELSQRLLDSGREFVFLFTDLSNPTANHIYQAIGFERVCDVDEYRFIPPGPAE